MRRFKGYNGSLDRDEGMVFSYWFLVFSSAIRSEMR